MSLTVINIAATEMVILLIPLTFIIYTIYHIVTNKQLRSDKKNIWIVVAVVFNILGCLLYWLLGNDKPSKQTKEL